MNVLTRLSDLIRVNVHTLIDRAENPEQMLAHLLQTLEEGVSAARERAAAAIAAERRLIRELEQYRASVSVWQNRAQLALDQGREDLARRALAQRIDYDELAGALDVQRSEAHQLSVDVKNALGLLQRRLAEARRRQAVLIARQRAAQVRLDVERFGGAGSMAGPGSRRFRLDWAAANGVRAPRVRHRIQRGRGPRVRHRRPRSRAGVPRRACRSQSRSRRATRARSRRA